MNKKLKIYSTLFIVVLICLIVTNVIQFHSYGWSQGGHDTLEFVEDPEGFVTRDTLEGGTIVSSNLPTVTYEVYVAPKHENNERVLLSTARKPYIDRYEEQVYKVNMQKVKLEAPASDDSFFNFPMIVAIVSAIVILVVTVWILCMVFKLIRRIRRGEIFVAQVSKYLETTGILLSALYLFQWITSYFLVQYCIENIQLTDYYVVYHNDTNSMYILTGLALMIISQIILMGKEMKEEQELTI